ncbi:MAG: 3'(2'),5'-bisphosphate nucleotidase CysQ [Pseudomonadota bacterium]
MTKIQYTDLRTAAAVIARDAAAAILTVYERDFDVQSKEDRTPLTEADLAAHAVIVDQLVQLTPAVPCVSEEGDLAPFSERGKWHRYWLIDPLDGTKEFVNRNGEFTVNIALIEGGYPVLGVVHVPVKNMTYSGGEKLGAFVQTGDAAEQPIQVATRCENPIRVVASRSHRGANLDPWLEALPETAFVPCGSSLKFCHIAAGDADVYPRFGPTSEWDTGAAQAVVEGAGGRVMTLDGKRLRYNSKESVLNPYFIVAGSEDHDWLRAAPNDG